MVMNGTEVHSLPELFQHFSIADLVYSYTSGELEIWLRKIGESEKASQLHEIQRQNACLLLRLYGVLDLEPEWTEEEVQMHAGSGIRL